MSEAYIKAVEDNHAAMQAKIIELINLVNDKQRENEQLKRENAELKARLIEMEPIEKNEESIVFKNGAIIDIIDDDPKPQGEE